MRFGKIRVEERPDPVSQIVGSFIGSRTYDWKSWDVFVRLVRRYPNWDTVADSPIADMKPCSKGLHFLKRRPPRSNRP